MRYSVATVCLLLTFLRPSVATDNENTHVRRVVYSEVCWRECVCSVLSFLLHVPSLTLSALDYNTRSIQVTTSLQVPMATARIVGGQNAVLGQNLYMVSLWSENRHECGGVLAAPDVVLTAAHCVQNGIDDPNVKIVKAILGRWDLNNVFESGSQVLPATVLLKHDNYNWQTDEHDVALIKLAQTSTLPTVKLNTGSDISLLSTGRTYTALGWGDLGDGTFPNILQEVQVDFMSSSDCRNAEDPMGSASYLSYVYDDMMCAFTAGKDGCQGDSGGPLLVRGSTASDDIVVGVTSWGVGCARMPGVYSRVDYHFEWIQENICLLSANAPSYFGCDETAIGTTDANGNIRDDPLPSPTTPPTVQPPTKAPTAFSYYTSPTRAPYTFGFNLPPYLAAYTKTPTAAPQTVTPPTAANIVVWRSASGGESTSSSASSRFSSSWATYTSMLLLSFVLMLGIALY